MKPMKRGRYKALDKHDQVIGWYKTEEEALAACFAAQDADFEARCEDADAVNARPSEETAQ